MIGDLTEADLTVYTTTKDDSPGEGIDCVQFNSDTKTFTSVTKGLDIDVSKYELSDLAVTFWCYSETGGPLFTRGRLRLSNGAEGLDKEANLDYAASKIYLKAGWNKITIPLDQWNAYSSATDKAFKLTDEIDSFRFHGCKNNESKELIIGEVDLVVVEQSNTNTTNGTQNSGGISTGDAQNTLPWVCVMIGAVVVMIYVVSKRKRYK